MYIKYLTQYVCNGCSKPWSFRLRRRRSPAPGLEPGRRRRAGPAAQAPACLVAVAGAPRRRRRRGPGRSPDLELSAATRSASAQGRPARGGGHTAASHEERRPQMWGARPLLVAPPISA